MIGTIIMHYEDKIEVTMMKNEEVVRKVNLIFGNEYVVNPVNPKRLKHRGRKVIFKGSEKNLGNVSAKVQFLDTKRPGKVDIGDLDNFRY